MMQEYKAQRRRGGANPLGVGVIAVGSSYYVQDEGHFRDRCSASPVCKDPWQVEGFTNGVMHAARRNRDTGRWENTYRSGRSDMAVVRSLRDGRRCTVAVRLLVLHDEGPFAHAPAGMTTRDEALIWLAGVRAGFELGEANGRNKLQAELRRSLNIR